MEISSKTWCSEIIIYIVVRAEPVHPWSPQSLHWTKKQVFPFSFYISSFYYIKHWKTETDQICHCRHFQNKRHLSNLAKCRLFPFMRERKTHLSSFFSSLKFTKWKVKFCRQNLNILSLKLRKLDFKTQKFLVQKLKNSDFETWKLTPSFISAFVVSKMALIRCHT